MKKDINNQHIEAVKEISATWKSIREVRKIVNEKFNWVLTFHNVRDILRWAFDSDMNSLPEEKSNKEVSEFLEFMKERKISMTDLHWHFYKKELQQSWDCVISDWVEEFEIGIVSDTHLWAKTCALSELHHFYKTCKDKWIKDVFHAWDLCDWWGKVYSGHLSELQVFGYDNVLDYVKDNYPKEEWVKTHFILGNHDEDFLKHWWANIGKAISQVREDMNYLWFYDADIIINWVRLWLHHWAGWASYAQSYKLQKYVENLTWDRKPQVYVLWHYHWALFTCIRNVHCILPACFQKPNNFSVRLWLPNTVWGYILKIKVNENKEIREITPTFIPYYIK